MKPVYIRSEVPDADRRVTCYVCGCPRCAEYPLAIRQQASGPYFPFLETHEPPDGAEPPSPDGKIISCFLCHSLLIQQWELYERDKVPPVKRIYWLKRVDNGPYTGVEVGVQSEYASQLLGLTPDPPIVSDVKRPGPSIGSGSSSTRPHPTPPIVPVTANNVVENKRPRLLPPQVQPPTIPLPPPGVLPLPAGLPVPQMVPQQEALDLSVVKPNDKGRIVRGIKRPLPDPPPQTESLDLSMPDKNATTEICYVCGDQHKKGTLIDIYAKQHVGCPFFPSLMLHSRPSKSHPMEPSGRVQGCRECYNHLQLQWQRYEAHKIPHGERNYSLRKRKLMSPRDSTAFVCYKCGSEFPSSELCLIYCKPNCEKEPYYSFILDLEPPDGSSPISPQGMVQVCSPCSKMIPKEQRIIQERSNETKKQLPVADLKNNKIESDSPVSQQTSSHSSALTQQSTPMMMPHPIETGTEEVACYLCHQTHHRQLMDWLPMVAEKNNPNGMYFRFLKYLPRMSSNTVIEDGKVLACHLCYQHLSTQWEEYEKDVVPTEHRQFSLRTMQITSHSPRLTPGSRHGSPERTTSMDGPSQQSFASTVEGHLKQLQNSSKKDSVTSGYLGQPLHTLEVVPATQDSNSPVLPVITTQHALNIAINCFVCSFHSKPGQTYALRSKAQGSDPFFPFLAKHQSAHPEARVDASSVLVCLCCFHSLILQWQQYEKAQVDHNARLYDTYNYSCFICSLKTYRKRLYLLPVKDYPFLKEHNRPSGGMVVDNGRSVVVCKDCYSSLTNQYIELERWGVPVERRQYNWIQRPPPPEFQQQELPASGSSKPSSSQGLAQVSTPGAGASSPGLHHGMPPEVLSQSAGTGRLPASPRGSQGPISKSSSAHSENGISPRLLPTQRYEDGATLSSATIPKITASAASAAIQSETPNVGTIPSCFAPLQVKIGFARQGGTQYENLVKRLPVASGQGQNSGDTTCKGFSGNSPVDQPPKALCLKRKILQQPTVSNESGSPIKSAASSVNHTQLIEKEKENNAMSKAGLNTNQSRSSNSPRITSPCSPRLVSPNHELQAKCS